MNPTPAFRKTLSEESGQIMLLAVSIGLILLIAVSMIVFVNQAGTLHQAARSQGAKNQSVAEEGIAYAIQELSANQLTWQNALQGVFPADCNSGNVVATPSNNNFKLYCSAVATASVPLQNYQVAVTAVALESGSTNAPGRPIRALQAVLSMRTLGVDLTNNLDAATALQMVQQPSITSPGALNVHWGPIVCLESAQNTTNTASVWTLPSPIDAGQYPRKFSVGGITGTAFSRAGAAPGSGPNSDQKEYWAYAPIAPPPLIDEATYIQQAQNDTQAIQPPLSKALGTPIAATGCSVAHVNCGYFQPAAGDTAIFGSGYALSGGPVIYVNGSAEFDQIAMDSATLIVTGALYINDSSGGNPLTLRVPPTAALEYPYSPGSQPCQGAQTCSSSEVFSGNVQFRGFLYVKGNIFVNTAGWTMAGALMVGDVQAAQGTSGILVIPGPTGPANASLNLAYDDEINHDILVNSISASGTIKIEPDAIQEVAPY